MNCKLNPKIEAMPDDGLQKIEIEKNPFNVLPF